jgi:heme-degrading monooxygenase HmoA
MSNDFQDFLKHQLAHVAIGEFKPGKFEQAQQLYEQAVATYTHGFKGAYLLREAETNKGISVIMWESIDAMDTSQNEAHQAILKKMAPLFTQAPTTAIYEVVVGIEPENLLALKDVN